MRSFLLLLFVLANLGIVAGYLFLAAVVVPKAQVQLARTKYGGIVFFLTCGFTHLELALHTLIEGGMDLNDMLSAHMLITHVVQVFAVWAFVTGLYIEFVKWGPWGEHWAQMTTDEGLSGPTRE